VSRAVASSNTLIDQLKAVQLVAMDAAPAEVQDSQWFKEFRTGIVNFNQTGAWRGVVWCVCAASPALVACPAASHARTLMFCLDLLPAPPLACRSLATVSLAAGTPASSPCQPGCISLDFLAGLAGLDTTCLCIQNTITAVQQHLQSTKQASDAGRGGGGKGLQFSHWLTLSH
jgi:hypothetical protein